MKKISFLFFLLLFTFLILFSPKSVFASARCYENGVDIGYMNIYSWHGTDRLVNNWYPIIWFVPNVGVVANDEVSAKIGDFSPGWTKSDLKEVNSYRIWTNTPIPDTDVCGQVWVNISWRSLKDGKTHYCNQLVPRYRELSNQTFLQSSCLANGKSCSFLVDPSLNKLFYVYVGHLGFNADKYQPSDPIGFCRKSKLWVGNQSISFDYNPSYTNPQDRCNLGMHSSTGFTASIGVNQGSVIAYLQTPSPITQEDFNAGTNWETIDLANNINNYYCGGQITTTDPTPTPVTSKECALVGSETAFSGSGTPLVNNYSAIFNGSPQYSIFNVNKSGLIKKAQIYSSFDRDVTVGSKVLQCKITNSLGTVNLAASDLNSGPFSKGVSWNEVQFSNPASVVTGTDYRLYCKVSNKAGGGYLYWLDFWNDRTKKTRKLYECN